MKAPIEVIKAIKMQEETSLTLKDIAKELDIGYKALQKKVWRYRNGEYDDSPILQGQEERIKEPIDCGDYYIIQTGKREISITKDKLRKLKLLYCDESPMTINEVCRKLNIPKRDFTPIKTAFNITHNDVPYLDEDLTDDNIDNLVEDTLQRRKDKYFQKLQQEEIKALKKEVNKYRNKEYFINKLHQETLEGLKEFSNNYEGPMTKLIPKNDTGLMLEIPIVDLHLGKLTWEQETGHNYDLKIAEKKFMSVIYDVVDRIKEKEFEKIVFPIGNDFFNFDNIFGSTTQGTQQDNDSRYHKMYLKGTELLIKAIDILQTIAPVEAFLIPGNHDFVTSFNAVDKVATWFKAKENPNVTVKANPKTRKYIQWGQCLIGFTHGDKEGKRIFGNMQVEVPKKWGNTKYREWHLGHLHKEGMTEEHGIKVRRLSSVTATDAWHYEKGYIGAIRTSQSFIWHKDKGLREVIYSNIE